MPTPIEQLRNIASIREMVRDQCLDSEDLYGVVGNTDWAAIIAWAEGLQQQLADARHAIKVSLGISQGVSWKGVPESAVDGWIEAAIALRDKP